MLFVVAVELILASITIGAIIVHGQETDEVDLPVPEVSYVPSDTLVAKKALDIQASSSLPQIEATKLAYQKENNKEILLELQTQTKILTQILNEIRNKK